MDADKRRFFNLILSAFICVHLRLNFLSQKVFYNSVKANQNPEKFYDESGEIEIEDERNDYQTCADGIKQRIKNTLAANFSEL